MRQEIDYTKGEGIYAVEIETHTEGVYTITHITTSYELVAKLNGVEHYSYVPRVYITGYIDCSISEDPIEDLSEYGLYGHDVVFYNGPREELEEHCRTVNSWYSDDHLNDQDASFSLGPDALKEFINYLPEELQVDFLAGLLGA